MEFKQPLIHGTLVNRYKRFLADIKLDDGSLVTAHCTNSGSMKSCLETEAAKQGVEIFPIQVLVMPERIEIVGKLPYQLTHPK